MKLHFLLTDLVWGDAIGAHCIALKKRLRELGVESRIYAGGFHREVAGHGVPVRRLLEEAAEDDILVHQFYQETPLLTHVERYPGRRVLMYHNITPPEFFPPDSVSHRLCRGGLRQLRELTGLYDLALGMSEFSRRDLEAMGYRNTGVFPLQVDPARLLAVAPSAPIMERGAEQGESLLFVGRVAPNKRIEDLVRFLAAYRALGRNARLTVVGSTEDHPRYVESLLQLARELSLEPGAGFVLAGKAPLEDLVAYYRSADAFVSMSEHEGFCAPLVQAMAFELPVFAYAAGAVEETLGGGGVLFRRKEYRALAETVAAVLDDPARKAEVLASERRRMEAFSGESERAAAARLLEECARLPSRAARRGTPRVSVVVPTYNRAPYLERCLAALSRQTYRNFEVLVVNGPSTDDTLRRLEGFRGRVRVLETRERRANVSRNLAIRHSRSELMAFLDDDAVPHPNWLKELVPAFDDPSVGGASGLTRRIDGVSVEWLNAVVERDGTVIYYQPEPGDHWNWDRGRLNLITGNNCMFRRSALVRAGGFDEAIDYYFDDSEVVLRFPVIGYRTVHRPRAIVCHESAPSENRLTMYDVRWRRVCKNTLYAALKNYSGDGSRLGAAPGFLRSLLRQRLSAPLEWLRQGAINFRTFLKIESGCLSGAIAGLWKGLLPAPRHRSFPPLAEPDGWAPFPRDVRRPLSVCLVSQEAPEERPGGIATYTIALARGLRDLGCSVHVVHKDAAQQSEYRERIWYHSTRPHSVSAGLGVPPEWPTSSAILDNSWAVWRKVQELHARFELDIVESPSWDSEGLVGMLDGRLPVVARLHGPLSRIMEAQGWEKTPDMAFACDIERAHFRAADGAVAATRGEMEVLLSEYGCDASRTALIPLGLDVPRQESSRNARTAKRVLYAGRLEPAKGIQVLLDAVPRIAEAVPDAMFDIAGKDLWRLPGGGMGLVRWREANQRWQARVRFHGALKGPPLWKLFEECDLVVVPSLYESFGLVVIEAMARGKAVVASRVGGIPEVVLDGETGTLVEPGDAAALAEAAVCLLKDDARRRRFGQAAQARYRESFTAGVMARATLAFYERVRADWEAARGRTIWRAEDLAPGRGRSVEEIWDPFTLEARLLAGAGPARFLCHGPSLRVAGTPLRAEFALSVESPPAPGRRICTLDVIGGGRLLGARDLFEEDFAAGNSSVFDIFVEAQSGDPVEAQLRVYTHGTAALALHWIVVGTAGSAPVAGRVAR